ncbi:MAG: heme-binding protein, partial [Burkholderiales bacterium]|nr:heme-binding protein [Burkholderiales bacterium]
DPNAFANGVAYSNRGLGNLARPYFPDGIAGANAGPLSVAPPNWSIFNVGLQLDLVANAVIDGLFNGKLVTGCAGQTPEALRIANGIQIFPGSVPIYRGNQLVGAIGISGDGIDQDDMVAFLGLANAGNALGTGIANAPAAIRDDNIVPQGEGTRLRYVNCPQAPFNGSTEQNVCAGY